MSITENNGYLRWWQFGIGILVLAVGLAVTFTRTESNICINTDGINRNTLKMEEYRIESKEAYTELKKEIDDIDEIKLNLKVMMEHFDLKYIKK
jgi:hypothetical protein